MIFTFAIAGASFGSWASRIPSLKNQLHLEAVELGGVLLVLAMASVASFPLAGSAIDRYGAVKVTRYLTWATLISLVMISLSSSVLGLTICVAIFGASLGALDVAMNGWGAEVERQGSKSIISSLHAYWSLFAGMGGLIGFLAVQGNFTVLQHFLVVSGLMGFVAAKVSRASWIDSTVSEATPMFAWPKKNLLFVGLLMFGAALAEGAVADWAAIFVVNRFNLTESMALSSFMIFSFAMFVGRMLADNLVDRYGAACVCGFGGGLATVGIGTILLSTVFSLVLAGFLLLGLGLAPVFPLGCARAANDPFVTPGQGLASVATFGYGGIMLGPAVIGLVTQYSGILMGFGLILACALYQLLFSWSLKQQ